MQWRNTEWLVMEYGVKFHVFEIISVSILDGGSGSFWNTGNSLHIDTADNSRRTYNTVISIMDADINNVEININNLSYSHSSQVVHSGSDYPYSVHLEVASRSCQN